MTQSFSVGHLKYLKYKTTKIVFYKNGLLTLI